jgi:hypothetical protein
LLAQLILRLHSQFVLFARMEPLPTIENIVQVAFYYLGPLVHELKPIPKCFFILYKLAPSIEKLRNIVFFLVEMLKPLNTL